MNQRDEQIRFAKIKFFPNIYIACQTTIKDVNLMKIRWIHINRSNIYQNFFSYDIHKSKPFDYIIMKKFYSCDLPLYLWNWLHRKIIIKSQLWYYVQMSLPNLQNADYFNSSFSHLVPIVNGNTKTIDIHFTTGQLSTHDVHKRESNNKLILPGYISSLTTRNEIPTTVQDKKWILFYSCGFDPILQEVTAVFLSPNNLSLEFSEILVLTLRNVHLYQDIINIIQNYAVPKVHFYKK